MGEIQGPAGRKCCVKTRKRVLGKSQRLLWKPKHLEMHFYAFIEQEKAVFPITWMCRKLGVSRASYYRWANPTGLTPAAARHLRLKDEVAEEFEKSNQMAGRDQLTTLLNQRGIDVSSGTVGAIMNELGVRSRRMRVWKNTTVSDPAARTEHITNHMLDSHGKRDFTAKVPGTRLVGDITYLKTGSGWLYLATVIDLATRMVVGWSMDSNMRTPLVINALAMARDHGRLHPAGAIFHSDRGPQYISEQFQKWCAGNEITEVDGVDRGVLG